MALGSLVLATVALFAQADRGTPAFEQAYREYRAAAEAYKNCDDSRAKQFLKAHAPDDIRQLGYAIPDSDSVARTGGRVPWHSDDLAAAYLLHLHAAQQASEPDGREVHLDIAAAHLQRLLDSHPRGELGEVTRLLWIAQLQRDGSVGELLRVLSRLPPDLREDNVFLLAIGSLHELLSTPLASLDRPMFGSRLPVRLQPLDGWGRVLMRSAAGDKRDNRDAAIARYREAIAARPSDAEAHLRLAFIFVEDGRFAEADSTLKAGEGREKPPVLQYYDAIVRARLAERQSRLEEAAAMYAKAAAIAPEAQTPILARGRVLLIQGRAREARAFLRTHLGRVSSKPDADPWWWYSFGQTWRRSTYVSQLERMVRKCDR